ncbi:MAG: hypothetical protein AAFV07_15770, partial [Bacteroidota bacterium]
LEWFDTWETLQQPPPPPPPFQINTLFMRSNLGGLQQITKTWIVDVFYLPAPVTEGPRPFFSTMWLIMDADTKGIIGYDLFTPADIQDGLQASFVRIVREQNYLPSHLAVHMEENLPWMRELADAASIELFLDTRMDFVDEVKMSLFGSMTTQQ